MLHRQQSSWKTPASGVQSFPSLNSPSLFIFQRLHTAETAPVPIASFAKNLPSDDLAADAVRANFQGWQGGIRDQPEGYNKKQLHLESELDDPPDTAASPYHGVMADDADYEQLSRTLEDKSVSSEELTRIDFSSRVAPAVQRGVELNRRQMLVKTAGTMAALVTTTTPAEAETMNNFPEKARSMPKLRIANRIGGPNTRLLARRTPRLLHALRKPSSARRLAQDSDEATEILRTADSHSVTD
jgi:hypothetical protein